MRRELGVRGEPGRAVGAGGGGLGEVRVGLDGHVLSGEAVTYFEMF